MWWNTNRRRGVSRGIDGRKSGFGKCISRGGGIHDSKSGFGGHNSRGRSFDDRKSRFGFRSGRGKDRSCSNRLSPITWNLMDQTSRFITSWWVGRYMNGSMSNRINFISEFGRSSIFRINMRRGRRFLVDLGMLDDGTTIR
jgi:hypothetical protein